MAYSKKQKLQFIEVLRRKNGHVSKACEAFDISRSTYHAWMKLSWFSKLVEEMKEEEIDDAEEALRMHRKGVPEYLRNKKGQIIPDEKGKPIIIGWLVKPDPKSVQFYLERKAKDRGYGKEQTVHIPELPNMPEVKIGLKVVKSNKKK